MATVTIATRPRKKGKATSFNTWNLNPGKSIIMRRSDASLLQCRKPTSFAHWQWSDITLDYGETGIIRLYRTKTKVERVHRIMPRTRTALLARKAHINKMRKQRRIPNKGDYVVGH